MKPLKVSLQIVLFLFLVFKAHTVRAQQNVHVSALPSAAKSFAAMSDTNVWAVQNNPAALAFAPRFAAGFAHKNYYSLKEVNALQANAAYNAKFLALGAAYSLFGNEFYRVGVASVKLARQLGDFFAIAIGGSMLTAYKEMEEYSSTVITPDVAFLGRTKAKFSYAFHVVNPFPRRNSTLYNKSTYKIGAAYAGIRNLNVQGMLQKTETEYLTAHLGLEYTAFRVLALHMGFSNSNTPFSFGIDAIVKQFRMGAACEFHSYMGISTVLALAVSL
jgi:hypothetical protein